MVDIMDAYRIVNQSILRVADDLVVLDQVEFENKPYQVRLEESPFSIAERRDRLGSQVVVCHDLNQYINKFYSINLTSEDTAWLDILLDAHLEFTDLTEFGDYV